MYMAEVHHGRALVDRQGGFAALQWGILSSR